MNIIIANQKGGAGKSTHCILLANYLVSVKNEEVIVLDMDFQSSIKDKWEKNGRDHDKNIFDTICMSLSDYPAVQQQILLKKDEEESLESLKAVLKKHVTQVPALAEFLLLADEWSWQEKKLYAVLSEDLVNYPQVKREIDKLQQGYVIIDLPGKMDDNNLIPVYLGADLILCPIGYDEISIGSTFVFAQVVRHINPTVPIVFLPTRIKPNVRYELKDQIKEKLSLFGTVAKDIPDKVSFQRLNTYQLSNEVLETISDVYEEIYQNFLTQKINK